MKNTMHKSKFLKHVQQKSALSVSCALTIMENDMKAVERLWFNDTINRNDDARKNLRH